ncbi:DNA-binding response regulator [Aliidongia dinghuensis]|uniref:Regulatory protein VirG n=1 Tax=Aliidongia dinghuensis TaxID=1867774 RepID=A0A8J3E547_9PROT|nr:response regulator [Aliidongia dinghuensis]GGF19331.1 DNA-binding response regulator [Aliidongia dinghuensis]
MSGSGQILVLDDDAAIRTLVRRCLEPAGFNVVTAATGADLRRLIQDQPIDLIVLDLNLKGEDGLDHLKALRRERDLPVIILTGRGEPIDRALGLELGADDYVAKPFEPRELVARVRTVLRRMSRTAAPAANRLLAFGAWKLDLDARILVDADSRPVALTTAQFAILSVLATHPNRVLSRDQILDLADRGGEPFDRSIDAHIVQLRRKIERDPRQPEIIKTVYGAGYLFRGD